MSRAIMRSILTRVLQVTDDDGVILDALLIMLESWNLEPMLRIIYEEHLKCQGLLMSSMSPFRNPQSHSSHWWWWVGAWHTSNHARKLKFESHVGNHIWRTFKMSRMTHVLHDYIQDLRRTTHTFLDVPIPWRNFFLLLHSTLSSGFIWLVNFCEFQIELILGIWNYLLRVSTVLCVDQFLSLWSSGSAGPGGSIV